MRQIPPPYQILNSQRDSLATPLRLRRENLPTKQSEPRQQSPKVYFSVRRRHWLFRHMQGNAALYFSEGGENLIILLQIEHGAFPVYATSIQ